MQPTTFYFIRHGETDFNRRRIVQGRKVDSTLNERGRAQAEALSRRFASVHLDAIYCSTLRRAEETALTVAREHPLVPVVRLRDLEEISWGIYEGVPCTPSVLKALDDMNTHWKTGEFTFAVQDGESALDVQQRALRALDHIIARHEGQSVMVVTHGRFLRILLATLLETYGLERMHEINHANTSVNHLVLRGSAFEAQVLNCTAHLDEVETIMIE